MKKVNYIKPKPETIELLKERFEDTDPAIRRDPSHDKSFLWRPAFIRDVEKIMNIPYYNRYSDKTQVFSLCKNDDISHRSYHVQLVSRIARNIGRMLGLDLDLIEAIALGHDIGHTPFGHAGERFLNEIYHSYTGRYFNHNVHSVRVLDKIFKLNLSLQTLDGILCHNGEFELGEYIPAPIGTFEEFDKKVEECYTDEGAIERLIPNTLEGCVVRVCDMIAYIGKDRQDAEKLGMLDTTKPFSAGALGSFNASIINNLVVNIVDNSIDKPYIRLSEDYFKALKTAKRENYLYIYGNPEQDKIYDESIRPMFRRIYDALRSDLINNRTESVIYTHHIDYINHCNRFRQIEEYGKNDSADDIVTDFIASMTDDYIIDLYHHLFNEDSGIEYISYFK